MAHRIGLSGSVIMTDPAKFRELFKPGIRHIEIGEFPDLQSFHDFLALLSGKDMTFGLHSPLLRNQSKYDLLEYVHVPTEQAWSQLERELDLMADLGAQYVLVHFPYFREKAGRDAPAMIENGLKRLHALQEKHGIPVVCEPKLGLGRSPVGIDALHGFPVETWAKYGLKLCIDIGDYLIAAGERVLEYVGKFRDLIKVVHLHNVQSRAPAQCGVHWRRLFLDPGPPFP